MPDTRTDIAEMQREVRQSLNQLRQDIISALTEIDVELKALRDAVLEAPVTSHHLAALREKARKVSDRFRGHYAQTISLFPVE